MSWTLRPVTGVEQLPEFEEGIAAALAGTTASVLCQCDRDRFDPVTRASVATFHARSVATATFHISRDHSTLIEANTYTGYQPRR